MTVLRLERADKLVLGLGGEQKRWGETCITLQSDLDNLVGNILLSAAAIAYAGPFTFEYRADLAEQWTKWCIGEGIKVDAQFSLKSCLADPVKVRQWNTFGLPTDELSVQNGLFVEWGRRWPLMIDPQSQANRWIKAMEKRRKLRVVKLTQGDFLRTLENCIRVGQPVLMENVEETLDPSLEPLLLKQTYKKGGRLVLRLGDSDVDYVEDFKFYLTSKLPNPHYAPATQVKVTIVNFTVTQKGLENQLLASVVALERPDLEEQAASLTMQINDGQNQIYELEGKILKLLSEAGDDMLDDDVLINTLDDAKKTSNEIAAQVAEAETTGKMIEETRELYRPAACRGSVLYFAVADMGNIDYMYQYSLQYFSKLFAFNIQNSEANADVAIRVETIINVCTVEIFLNICRGLFEKDKILFAAVIAFSVMRNSGEIAPSEWGYFISGSGLLDFSSIPEWPGGNWLLHKTWVELYTLANRPGCEAFKGIDESLKADEAAWQEYGVCDCPHERDLPAGWSGKLSSFQQMLVLKIIRPEKMVFGIPNFVQKHLGDTFIESQPFDLSASYTQSDSSTPIIFVLSSGADPTAYLMKLARDSGFYDKIKVISLGQGQGPKAEVLIETAIKDGESTKWVCLQNCHLAASWMSTLESMIEKIASVWDVHNDFRLFLTSMPTTSFPVTILQAGIKLTNEPPKGLKANIRGSFFDIEQDVFESCTKQREWKILLFSLCFFHAIVQERRKFGALGWNIRYDWNNSDRSVSITMLSNYLDEQPEVPWTTLRYVIAETNYGGRVTDSWDQRCVNAMFARYYIPEILSGDMNLEPKGVYQAVECKSLDEFRAYIDGRPATETPDAFGLHPNAEITFQRNEASKLIGNIVALQPRTSSGGGAKPEDTAIELARSILARVPPIMDMDEAHEVVFAKDPTGAVNSLGLFLSMEIIRFNPLLSVMKKTLKELELSLQGLAVMTGELDAMFSAFLIQKVPPNWEKHCYISLKPLGSWVEDLFARVVMMDKWLHEGPPAMFWLAGFFFPQGFMTAVLQTHSRKFSIAIDTLAFKAEVQKEAINSELAPAAMHYDDGITMDTAVSPENGVKIFGMFMQGARWDREKHAIGDSEPGILFTQMPIILLDPIVTDGKKINEYASPEGYYRCPMYKTSTRAGTLSTTGHSTNYVVALNLPSLQPAEHWVCCGVAMLTMLDE
jgi:dynein heavy chain